MKVQWGIRPFLPGGATARACALCLPAWLVCYADPLLEPRDSASQLAVGVALE